MAQQYLRYTNRKPYKRECGFEAYKRPVNVAYNNLAQIQIANPIEDSWNYLKHETAYFETHAESAAWVGGGFVAGQVPIFPRTIGELLQFGRILRLTTNSIENEYFFVSSRHSPRCHFAVSDFPCFRLFVLMIVF